MQEGNAEGLSTLPFVTTHACTVSGTMRIAVPARFRRGCPADFAGSFDTISVVTVCIVESDSKDPVGSSVSFS